VTIKQHSLDEAADWHAAMSGENPDFEGFAAWLEAAPENVRAYDAVAVLDDIVEANKMAIQMALPANDMEYRERPQRRKFLMLALAAAALIPGAVWFGIQGQSVELSAGHSPLRVALDSRTNIVLDRDSLLRHGKNDFNTVELAQGAAHFSVIHDPKIHFTVKAGDVSVVDLGTQFEVQRNGNQVGVLVAEGSVAVAFPGSKQLTLTAGQQAFVENGIVTTRRIDVGSVASWRKDRLVYRDTPLQQVAKEISRYTPAPITIDPSLSDRRFSGVLTIGDGHSLDKNLADFMDLARSEQDGSVRISPKP
jgi:transmembrane sensor